MNDYPEDERTLKRAVREILGGKSVNDFPINMIPKIKNYLYDLKEKAVSLGQNDRIKLIQKAFIQINELERKQQKINMKNEQSSEEQIKPTESELENMINKMMAGEQMEPFNVKLIPPLIKCIKKRIQFHIQRDEFEMAQNYEDLHQILFTEYRNGETTGHKEWLQKKIMDRLEKAEQKLREIEQAYEEKLKENEKITNDAIEKINQQNQVDLNNFDAETQGPLPPFTKTFSSELQGLRETQKKLIVCKRFKEAADVRDKIKEIIEIELEDIEDKHFRSREAQREQIIDAHYQRIDCIMTKSESQRINIDDFFQKKIDSLKNQIAFFERQLDLINTSKRFKMQFDPAISFENQPDEFQPKVLKTRTPMSVRQLSMRDPWSLFFDSSKRLNVTKIDELAEPRWKTIEPRQTDTEVYSEFVSSLVSTPKSWDRVHRRKISSARPNRQNWQTNPSIYSINRRNKSEEKKRRVSMKINIYDNENDENGFSNNINTTPNRVKKKRSKKGLRSSSLVKSKSGFKGVDIYSAAMTSNGQSNRNNYTYNESNRNSNNGRKINVSNSTSNVNSVYNSSNNSRKQNTYNSNDNKISIANSTNYNNLVSNFESASTYNQNNMASSTRQSDKYSSLSGSISKSKITSHKTISTSNQLYSNSDNNQKVSISSSSANYISNNNNKSSVSIQKSKKSNQSDPLELSSNIYFNGLTYTQTIDARRNKATQSKKNKSLANLFGEKSDFERFCQTVPPSRKEQLPNYI